MDCVELVSKVNVNQKDPKKAEGFQEKILDIHPLRPWSILGVMEGTQLLSLLRCALVFRGLPPGRGLMKWLPIVLLTAFGNMLYGQDYMFVGTYAPKDATRSYWCLDRNKLDMLPVRNHGEYDAARKNFYDKKHAWPSAYLLTPKSAALIAEITVKDKSFNCSYKAIIVEFGATVDMARQSFMDKMKKNEGIWGADSRIVFTWNPKGTGTPGDDNESNKDSDNGGSGGNGYDDNNGGAGQSSGSDQGFQSRYRISDYCVRQNISIANGPAMNCVQLRWFTQSTIQYNDKTNEVKTNYLPTEFVLHYKKSTDIYWKSLNISGYQMGYNLKALDPCTKYEVKLQRYCGNGKYSDFSNTIIFTTACPMPGGITSENITSTSAKINSRYAPGVNVCSPNPKSVAIQIEYAAPGANWQTVYSNVGTGGSVLYNLQPNTSYRVRARYDFGNQIYSRYSNEIVFKTKE